MWINKPGKVNAALFLLGTPDNPLYLVKTGDGWLLIEGGLLRDADLVMSQLGEIVPRLQDIRHWFITHSHYDHCGLLPVLLPHMPEVKLYASAAAIAGFRYDKYMDFVLRMQPDRETLNVTGNPFYGLIDQHFECVADGDELSFNGWNFRVLATPGHSDCHLSLYSEQQWLFASDALGHMMQPHDWFPLIFQHAGQYMESVGKVNALRVSMLALGHHGLLTDTFATTAPSNSFASTNHYIDDFGKMLNSHPAEEVAAIFSQKYAGYSKGFFNERMFKSAMLRMISILKTEGYIA
ncbi:MBL fold metallo-hydrolase [Chitinophaga sp. 212800010-3]|uniref:MBL fold metallo-hydrolase n=1 Tax=unclassified Chitinophaga TaxID=2619133 RepID=UPI002DED4649|nr:MBL fold metallo-hydrolase [Chitinophaga sp. 212800010-3]